MSNRFSDIWRWCNRYFSLTLLAVAAAVVFVVFLNDNSVMRTYELEREIERLQLEIADHRDTLVHYPQLNTRLETDARTMEQIVREQYHMQRAGEDVYLTD